MAFWFIYKKIFLKNDVSEVHSIIQNLAGNSTAFLFLILMMMLNWTLEIMKWNRLVRKVQSISFLQSLKAVTSGITVSIFTPNRAGEFGGRIFYLEKQNRVKGVLLSMIGGLSQLLITLTAGITAFLFYLPNYTNINNYSDNWLYYTFFSLMAILVIASFIIYFNAPSLLSLFSKYPFMSRIKKYFSGLSEHTTADLFFILALSFFRYIIFSLQFYWILYISGVALPLWEGLIMIALTFFAISLIPTITITEIGIRGSAALAFIGLLSQNDTGIVAASFVLWLINIAVPALAGIIFVFQLKFFDQDS